MNVIQFPKVDNKKNSKVSPISTTIIIVNFKNKEVIGETEIDNLRNLVVGQWGEKPTQQKKVA